MLASLCSKVDDNKNSGNCRQVNQEDKSTKISQQNPSGLDLKIKLGCDKTFDIFYNKTHFEQN